jgi:hypothetical protein
LILSAQGSYRSIGFHNSFWSMMVTSEDAALLYLN